MKHSPSPSSVTRRGFLGTGAATLGTLSLARSAYAAGRETIRVGMIGCGGRCSGAAVQSLKAGPFVRLVAMYDVFADRIASSRAAIAVECPDQVDVDDAHCFTEFDGYARVIEASDVVLIACASKFHPMYAEAAIDAGKHVFVEKPHGIDPVGALRMRRACEKAAETGLSLVSGLQSRFDAGYRATVEQIHAGAIGDVVAMQSMFLRGPYRLEARAPEYTETQYQFRNWYHFRWLSGDDVTQSLVHNVDRMSWILHEQTPKWCFGLGGRSSSFGEVYGDMFDHHTAVYEYESGVRLYALCRTQVGCYNNGGDVVMGTKGICHLDRCRIEGENPWSFEGDRPNAYQVEQSALIEAVRTGVPLQSGDHMASSTMLAILGQVACYTGKPVTWDELIASELEFGPAPDDSSFATPPPTTQDATHNYPLPRPGQTKLL